MSKSLSTVMVLKTDINDASLQQIFNCIGNKSRAYRLVAGQPYRSWEQVAHMPKINAKQLAKLKTDFRLTQQVLPPGTHISHEWAATSCAACGVIQGSKECLVICKASISSVYTPTENMNDGCCIIL